MAYSDKVVDHYNNPRNVGSFTKDTPGVGTGLVGAPECGDVMKLQIKVNVETGVIEDAKFKTFGCGSAIASSSLATEWLKGRTVDEAYVNGHPERRLPHNLNISFAYVEGESVLMGLNREAALASGSACTSATLEPSYVISALGVDSELAHSSMRFGLHRFSTEEEVDFVAGKTIEVIHRLREMSPLYELAKEGVDLKSIHWKAE